MVSLESWGFRIAKVEVFQAFPRAAEITPEGQADGVRFEQRNGLKLWECLAGCGGVDLVLNHDVGLKALAVLRDEIGFEGS